MVAQGLRPAATVEGEGFRALMRYVEPGYKVLSAVHIAKVVHQKHDIGKRALKERLQMEGQSIAITSDIWTSCANDAYISLTAHFITTDWQMVSCVLATIVAHFQGTIQVSILLISWRRLWAAMTLKLVPNCPSTCLTNAQAWSLLVSC